MLTPGASGWLSPSINTTAQNSMKPTTHRACGFEKSIAQPSPETFGTQSEESRSADIPKLAIKTATMTGAKAIWLEDGRDVSVSSNRSLVGLSDRDR